MINPFFRGYVVSRVNTFFPQLFIFLIVLQKSFGSLCPTSNSFLVRHLLLSVSAFRHTFLYSARALMNFWRFELSKGLVDKSLPHFLKTFCLDLHSEVYHPYVCRLVLTCFLILPLLQGAAFLAALTIMSFIIHIPVSSPTMFMLVCARRDLRTPTFKSSLSAASYICLRCLSYISGFLLVFNTSTFTLSLFTLRGT